MKLTAFLAAATVLVGVSAVPSSANVDLESVFGVDLSVGGHYGCPNPPWVHGSQPGWYYGKKPYNHGNIPCLFGPYCKLLDHYPYGVLHCPKPPHIPPPPPSDGYTQTFSNLTGATQAGDFLTFGLVDTITECKTMCNSVSGCHFVNTYHDVNGKGGSTQLTCSLFSACHTASDADNKGGQSQPNGSIDFITNSDGFCNLKS